VTLGGGPVMAAILLRSRYVARRTDVDVMLTRKIRGGPAMNFLLAAMVMLIWFLISHAP
jgi:hypothetical protein